MEERVKRYRSLGHIVNFFTTEERCYPASVITFTKDELRAVHLPHDDPLVIKLQVHHCQLGRVLVDEASGIDVLFWEAFQKMGLEEKVDFLIVDSITSYNAIMGGNWTHRMQGVVSTLHQVMRCQSPNGHYTIDIKGYQRKAKKCYLTLKEINKIDTSTLGNEPTK
ncbi:uncharacterized protein LOC133832647 [Humulus lupulus]|uniref:uncharacterized protein LOC133832647 n=1 Tax=Humulus lupulus TaxID=3486 RepID=UPI002B410989|nr:uncharacterized protein LOC133832647 [Humulus lupulus]